MAPSSAPFTERTHAQLRDLMANMQAILDHSTECYVLAGLNGIIRMINPSAQAMIYANEGIAAVEGNNFFSYFDPVRLPVFMGYIDQVRNGNNIAYTRQILRTDGRETWVEFLLTPVTEEGQITAVCIRARDVTSVKKESLLQQALLAEKAERQHQLTKAAILAQEQQRAETGKELHDNINQMLASASVFLQYSLTHDRERIDGVQKSLSLVQQCMDEIRKLSKRLVPPSLDDLGLRAAIGELLQTLRFSGPAVSCTGLKSLPEHRMTSELRLALYRMLQEQVSNILRHAQATRVSLRFKAADGQLRVTITDNGRGFDPLARRQGIGLDNIINRAAVYHGQVEMVSSPGKGAILRLQLPIGSP